MKKINFLMLLAVVTMYACTCISSVSFDPGLDVECIEEGIEDWNECQDFLDEIDNCVPVCEEQQECGDDGCGGECGRCPNAAPFCNDGVCEQVCEPDCDGRECGDDGCGDSCGECPGAAPFCIEFLCNTEEPIDPGPIECIPNCENRECGPDGCGDQCGVCTEDEVCVFNEGATECVLEEDTASCNDSCGAFTGSCWCDSACFLNDDCCEDVCDTCAEEDEDIANKCSES